MLRDASFIELGRFGKSRCFLTFHDVSVFDSENQNIQTIVALCSSSVLTCSMMMHDVLSIAIISHLT